MATHSSILAWRIPGTGEPGGLPSMGSHRVGHDRSDLAAAAPAVTITSLDNCSFVVNLKVGSISLPTIFFFCIILTILCLLPLHINFRMSSLKPRIICGDFQ